MAVATGAALCLVEFFHHLEVGRLVARDDHLGDGLAVVDAEAFLRGGDEPRPRVGTARREPAEIIEVEELTDAERGSGGFGHTGKK